MSRQFTTTVDENTEIRFLFTPEDHGVRTFRNGDPGYPGTPAEAELLSIKINGVEISIDKQPEEEIERWQNLCVDYAENTIADEQVLQYEEEQERRRELFE